MLTLTKNLAQQMIQHAQREHPIECCGVIAGPINSDHAIRCIEMQNAANSECYFEYDPKEHFNVWQEMEEKHEEPIVLYHSHTDSIAYPSQTDILYASEPFAHFVIIQTNQGHDNCLRSFRIIDNKVTEETITIINPD